MIGFVKMLNIFGDLVLKLYEEVFYFIVRNNLENDLFIMGLVIIFDNNSFVNNLFYVLYVYWNLNDLFIKVIDLFVMWSYFYEVFVRLMCNKLYERFFLI